MDYGNLIRDLTAETPGWDYSRRLNDFAAELGWRPSDKLDLPGSSSFSSGHLIVEHGLEYTAVVSFLTAPYKFGNLNPQQQKMLVNASYNNLIDWNISVDSEGVSFIFNRFQPPDFYRHRESIEGSGFDSLKSSSFLRVAKERPSPNVPALDRAVIETISIWKRQLGGALPAVSNTSLSALFNSLLLLRAAEDNRRYREENMEIPAPLLPSIGRQLMAEGRFTFAELVRMSLADLRIHAIPDGLIDIEALSAFESFDHALSIELLDDFYKNRFARYYDFDFRLMSKHALSRIYEHYVSVLRVPDPEQESLFPKMAEEEADRRFGNVYTPEYIAKFFARYLRLQLPLRTFQKLKITDPACGSGIFLRAFLELQNELLFDERTTEEVRRSFHDVSGIDIDSNACYATRLSISLLSLFLVGGFPARLNVINADSMEFYLQHPELKGTCDVIVANPPYVKLEAQSAQQREMALRVLGQEASGRADLYLAMLKIAVEALKPGGYGLFVLPETFLKADAAKRMRATLSQVAWIRVIVDLTATRVFENVGVYPILLIFEIKSPFAGPERSARIVQCRGNTPAALQDVLSDRLVRTSFYSIHESPQSSFGEEWSLATPEVDRLRRKISVAPSIETDYVLRQGMNTASDKVFIISSLEARRIGEPCFVPLLSDREMGVYSVPEHVSSYVFYPYLKDSVLDEEQLRSHFPRTWSYLLENRSALEGRRCVIAGTVPWWKPERARKPSEMLRAKIVTPHIVMAAKFACDLEGKFAISRSPFILSRANGSLGRSSLLYLLGVLNSSISFWDLSQRSHVYSRGYSRLELSTFRQLRIPSPSGENAETARKLERLVATRLSASGVKAFELESEMDKLVADLYGLDESERMLVGMEAV